MIVCSCHAVSDSTVKEALDGGASDLEQVGAKCAAGTGCGGCHKRLERMLNEHTPSIQPCPNPARLMLASMLVRG